MTDEERQELHECVQKYKELVEAFSVSTDNGEPFSREAFEERTRYRHRAMELLKKS